jgi:hypothetical protein
MRRLTALWWGIVLPCALPFALLIALPFLGAGCLYTDRINVPPSAQISMDPTLTSDGGMTFYANAQDDQPTGLTESWTVTGQACPTGQPLPTGAAIATGSGPSFTFDPPGPGVYCVSVVVTDAQGATGYSTRTVTVSDRPPTMPVITAVAPAPFPTPVPLYSNLHFSGSATDPDPGDAVTLTWSLTKNQIAGSFSGCGNGAVNDVCFQADVPGDYVLTLTATDSHGTAAAMPATLAFTVATDQPPCITAFNPSIVSTYSLYNQGATVTFAVTTVADDGDPWPRPSNSSSQWPQFFWSAQQTPGGPLTRLIDSQDLYNLNENGIFEPGQSVQVRVEVQDRVDRTAAFAQCADDQTYCDLSPGCHGWVTWTVTFL